MQRAIVTIEDRRSPTTPGSTSRASATRSPGRRRAQRGPGRLDDRPAVRRGPRSRAQDQTTILQKAARGGAGLPPHAQVVEGEDPHRVPIDRLRRRRVRDRVGGADVLRHPARRLRARRQALRKRLTPTKCALLAGDVVVAEHVRPGREPVGAKKRRDLVLLRPVRAGLSPAPRTYREGSRRRCRRDGHPAALHGPPKAARGVLRELGRASRSPTATAPGARSRAACASHDARHRSCSERPSRPSRVARAGPADRRRRSSRSTTRTGEVGARVGGDGLRAPPVQPRNPGPAPPARRSSRSCSRPRSSAGSRRARCGRRRS